MKIIVLGASQGTGALAVKEALSRGHEVTAFSRNPDKLQVDHPKLKKVAGDFHQKASVANALKDHDAVVVTASASSLGAFKTNPYYFSLGTGYAIEGMQQHGVKRLVVLSALGTGDSKPLLPWLVRKLLVDWLLKIPYADHVRQEKITRDSDLDWVIVRPGRLTNDVAKKQYVKTAKLESVPASISRADTADFLVEAATNPEWVRKAVHIGG